jgi:hypothetical protein
MAMKDKRDFEIRLFRDPVAMKDKRDFENRLPPGPSLEELQQQRERDAEKARKDAEYALKCKLAWENHPAMDPDYLHKLEAAKSKGGCLVVAR